MDARAGSLWHKTAGASNIREAIDQLELSNVGARPMRVDQSEQILPVLGEVLAGHVLTWCLVISSYKEILVGQVITRPRQRSAGLTS